MKRKYFTIQSRSIERNICDDLLYRKRQQHFDHPRAQHLNEGPERLVELRTSSLTVSYSEMEKTNKQEKKQKKNPAEAEACGYVFD